MPIEITWLVEGRVLYDQITGSPSIDEFRAGGRRLGELMTREDGQLVHILLDISAMKRMPTQIGGMSEASRPFMAHPNAGWIIAFGSSDRMVNLIGTIVSQIFRSRFRFFRSLEESLRFLQEQDSTLPPLDALRPAITDDESTPIP